MIKLYYTNHSRVLIIILLEIYSQNVLIVLKLDQNVILHKYIPYRFYL